MASWLNFLYYATDIQEEQPDDLTIFTVAVAESVTAGALANTLCSEPGASQFFRGGIIAYSIESKQAILGIDTDYAEMHNFANELTTNEMAKAAADKFKARFGLATTGYSLPIQREASETQCALNISNPYTIISMYDGKLDIYFTETINFEYNPERSDRLQRAEVQTKTALMAKKMYQRYIVNL